jgi:hypothetical protein
MRARATTSTTKRWWAAAPSDSSVVEDVLDGRILVGTPTRLFVIVQTDVLGGPEEGFRFVGDIHRMDPATGALGEALGSVTGIPPVAVTPTDIFWLADDGSIMTAPIEAGPAVKTAARLPSDATIVGAWKKNVYFQTVSDELLVGPLRVVDTGAAAPSPEAVHDREIELEPFVFDSPGIQESERRLQTTNYLFDGDVAYFRVRGPDNNCYQIGRLRLDTREEELLGALSGRSILKIEGGEMLELAGRNTDNDGRYLSSRARP